MMQTEEFVFNKLMAVQRQLNNTATPITGFKKYHERIGVEKALKWVLNMGEI